MLSTRRGSKWCSCYGWLWVFPKPWYLNSSLRSTPGGRQRYFFIDSIQSVAVLFCSIWDDDDHQGHLGLKCRGADEMCCIIGSTTHTGHFFHWNSRIAQDGWSWGGEETNWLENVFKVRLIRFDVQCTLYIMDSWLHSEVDFIGNRCHQNVGRPKPKQNCRRDEKYKFNVYNVVRLNRSA